MSDSSHAETPSPIPSPNFEWGVTHYHYASALSAAAASSPTANNAASLPHSSSNPDEDGMSSRSASYFFGFLITFIFVLLVCAGCAIRRRRRMIATGRRRNNHRRRLGLEGSEFEDQEAVRFRGLLASTRTRRHRGLSDEEILKNKPTYHEIWVALDSDKPRNPLVKSEVGIGMDRGESQTSAGRNGTNGWGALEPLAASITRTPKDLQPYQYFHGSTATHLWNRSSNSQHTPPRDMPPPYEDTGAWYHRIPPSWTPFGVGLGGGSGASSSSGSRRARSPSDMYPNANGQHYRTPSHEIESEDHIEMDPIGVDLHKEPLGPGSLDRDRSANVVQALEVAVMVIMPSPRSSSASRTGRKGCDLESAAGRGMSLSSASSVSNAAQNVLPECQIGVTHARMAG